ncbi:MAG: cyclic nucleotide-binding domain-containing protein [Methylosarcina sp.]
MSVDIISEEGQLIRKFVPFVTMPVSSFNTLCAEMNIEEVTDGTLFKRGDVDSNLIYLLSGKVILQADGLVIEAISANTEAARFALAHQIPRKIDAVAKGTVRFLRLDANKVNNLPPFEYKEDTSFMSVDEAEVSGDDWMTALLKLPVFQRLPPANLQKILMGLELVEYDKGVTVIEQGASGDYYYLIKSGQCLISRRPSASAKEIKLGVMDKGDTFGEDSLITGAPRTVTITALTDLSLLRLNKQQFISLIKEPSLKFVEYEELGNVGTQGGILMDIRAPDEYEKRHLESSVNFPFFSLRMQLKTLSRDKTIVVICADGKLSEAGAFLLLKNKFNALILKGGMAAVPAELVREFAQFTIDDGIETLVDPKEADLLENRPEPEGDPSSGAENGHWENQIKFLKLENEALRRTNQLLNEKYEKLKIEKSDIEKEYRIVYQKLESMMRLGESR